MKVTLAPPEHQKAWEEGAGAQQLFWLHETPWDTLLQDTVFDCLIFVLLGGRVVFEGILLKNI